MPDNSFKRAFILSCFFCFFPVLVFVTEVFFQTSFSYVGIFPRTLNGLIGVLFAPFLHANIEHLMANLFPLWIGLFALFSLYPNASLKILWSNAILTSLLVWIFARPNIHIGASGVLYGINAFLLVSGFVRWEKAALTFGLLVLVVNQGVIYGMLPVNPEVSYESHIAGFVTGLIQAFWFKQEDQKAKIDVFENETEEQDGPWNYKPFTIEGREETNE